MRARALFVGLLALALGGCSLIVNDNGDEYPGSATPVTLPPSPAPSATPPPPPPTTAASDVVSLGVYDVGCATQDVPFEFSMAPDCLETWMTATPKTDKDLNGDGKADDATHHGPIVLWRINGVQVPDSASDVDFGCVYVSAGPFDQTFNRKFRAKSPRGGADCRIAIEAELPEPGKSYFAYRTLVVRPPTR